MPRYISAKIHVPVGLLSARVLFPFGISFFIPLFVYTLTMEKESRIFIMMKVTHRGYSLTVDEWVENLGIFLRSLRRLCSFGYNLNDHIPHSSCGISTGDRIHQSRPHHHSVARLDQHRNIAFIRALNPLRQRKKCPHRNLYNITHEHPNFDFRSRDLGELPAKRALHLAAFCMLHCRRDYQ